MALPKGFAPKLVHKAHDLKHRTTVSVYIVVNLHKAKLWLNVGRKQVVHGETQSGHDGFYRTAGMAVEQYTTAFSSPTVREGFRSSCAGHRAVQPLPLRLGFRNLSRTCLQVDFLISFNTEHLVAPLLELNLVGLNEGSVFSHSNLDHFPDKRMYLVSLLGGLSPPLWLEREFGLCPRLRSSGGRPDKGVLFHSQSSDRSGARGGHP